MNETDIRRHDLDALRGLAMLLGIVLHAVLAFFPSSWPVQDRASGLAGLFDEVFLGIHGFRMPVFFLLSGYFTTMLWRRRGLRQLLWQRLRRIGLPLAIGLVTVVPLLDWMTREALASTRDIWLAVLRQDTAAVARILDSGLDPNAPRGDGGATPLHTAALVGDASVAELLLDAGADPDTPDDDGGTPLGFAFWAGSEAVADLLVSRGVDDVRPPGTAWADLQGWGEGSDARALTGVLPVGSWLFSFYHLWFLWLLLWLVAGFALPAYLIDRRAKSAAAAATREWPRWAMWALVPLTMLPQLAMGNGGAAPFFGPDTSAGVVPVPHVLAYYALFFSFGALLYGRRDRHGTLLIDALGRRWKLLLPTVIFVVLPLGLLLTFMDGWRNWTLASMAQVAYSWGMTFALIGVFRSAMRTERRGVRYLADSSYWLYFSHLPLVIAGQLLIRDWEAPAVVKFSILVVGVTGLLLAGYQLLVRYTPVGSLFNGKRPRLQTALQAACGTDRDSVDHH